MSDKLYEYRDATNWFVGRWGDLGRLSQTFGDITENFYLLGELLDTLVKPDGEEKQSFQVEILQYQSKLALITFIVDMINQEQDRQLKVSQRQAAILVTEQAKLLQIFLPEQGIELADFMVTQVEELTSFHPQKILIATKNEGKTREFRHFFEKLGYEVENLNQYPDLPDVAETGTTFEENARLKAETIAQLTGQIVLADDSGLKVDALGGLPGVWSARFGGPETTDERNNAKLLHELAMVFEQKDRSAQFHCTLVVASPQRESLVVEADWPGYIAAVPRGEGGFGYDPLFLVGNSGQTAAELDLEEKNKISHRALALNKLMEVFPAWQRQS